MELQDDEKLQKEINKIRQADQELTSIIFHELYNALHVQRESLLSFEQKQKELSQKSK